MRFDPRFFTPTRIDAIAHAGQIGFRMGQWPETFPMFDEESGVERTFVKGQSIDDPRMRTGYLYSTVEGAETYTVAVLNG